MGRIKPDFFFTFRFVCDQKNRLECKEACYQSATNKCQHFKHFLQHRKFHNLVFTSRALDFHLKQIFFTLDSVFSYKFKGKTTSDYCFFKFAHYVFSICLRFLSRVRVSYLIWPLIVSTLLYITKVYFINLFCYGEKSRVELKYDICLLFCSFSCFIIHSFPPCVFFHWS